MTMSLSNSSTFSLATLAHTMEEHVNLRTWRRIHRLRVETKGDRIILSGHTPTYYVKQLALQAILDILKPHESTNVVVDIQVGPVTESQSSREKPRGLPSAESLSLGPSEVAAP